MIFCFRESQRFLPSVLEGCGRTGSLSSPAECLCAWCRLADGNGNSFMPHTGPHLCNVWPAVHRQLPARVRGVSVWPRRSGEGRPPGRAKGFTLLPGVRQSPELPGRHAGGELAGRTAFWWGAARDAVPPVWHRGCSWRQHQVPSAGTTGYLPHHSAESAS